MRIKNFIVVIFMSMIIAACGDTNKEAREEIFIPKENVSSPIMANIGPVNNIVDNEKFNTNLFDGINENVFKEVATSPLSTFSADVDTASYALIRMMIDNNELPNKGAVRIEELINSFKYNYATPKDKPLAIHTELSKALWNPNNYLLKIGIQGKEIDWDSRSPSNLILLIDTSGSMYGGNKLPLLQKSLKLLVENLDKRDTIGIVTYAGYSSVALEPTNDKEKILKAINSLRASGSTNGAGGIESAYELASKNFIKGGINRVILATDGDFNVGVTSQDELLALIKDKAKSGVYLSIFGFGYGNYKDSTLVKLADSGNGNYAYINNILEAKKHLVEQVGASFITIAKDVKIQVEFNPALVHSYRLIGYEKRILNNEDFNDDSKDAGEIGSGHSVTALYEIVPAKNPSSKANKQDKNAIDPLKYTKNVANGEFCDEVANVKIRYKEPTNQANSDEKSKLIELSVKLNELKKIPSSDMKFAMSVAGFGMVLLDSQYRNNLSYDKILATLNDKEVLNNLDRQEFMGIVAKTSKLSKK